MPTLAQDQQAHHEAVARCILLARELISVHVGDAVDCISYVIEGDQGYPKDEDTGETPAPPGQQDGDGKVQEHEDSVRPRLADPVIERIGVHIAAEVVVLLVGAGAHEGVEQHAQRACGCIEDAQQHVAGADVPTHMRVPEAAMDGRVRVERRVGVRVMEAVVANPLHRSAGGQADDDNQPLQPAREAERAMRQHAVIAEIDPQSGEQIVHDHKHRDGRSEHQKCPISSNCKA